NDSIQFITSALLRVVQSFFFSSRRRHTRWPRDWSSYVCSSDLSCWSETAYETSTCSGIRPCGLTRSGTFKGNWQRRQWYAWITRSEERRVGKECRYRWVWYNQTGQEEDKCLECRWRTSSEYSAC